MRLRRAVLQTLPRISVPLRSPLYKHRPLRTRSESTLLQVLIPLHFNSPRMCVYKKPGEGAPLSDPNVLQLVTTNASPMTPLPGYAERRRGTLTVSLQLPENKSTLGPTVANPTSRVRHKSFACHSYRKHRGVGYPLRANIFFSNLKAFRLATLLPGTFPRIPRILSKERSATKPCVSVRRAAVPRGTP
jgi:hypothetical protein